MNTEPALQASRGREKERGGQLGAGAEEGLGGKEERQEEGTRRSAIIARLCFPGRWGLGLHVSLEQVGELLSYQSVICSLASRGGAPSILPLELGANAHYGWD